MNQTQLAQPYDLGSMRLLLWDCDDRSYAFDIYVSTDRKNWQLVVRKDELCRSWQFMEFDSKPVVYFQDRKLTVEYQIIKIENLSRKMLLIIV